MKCFDCLKTIILVKPVKQDKYYQIQFYSPNDPHIAKLNFSGILKHFRGNCLKTSLLGLQSEPHTADKAKNYSKIFFNMFEMG